jgi:hypothetical protein
MCMRVSVYVCVPPQKKPPPTAAVGAQKAPDRWCLLMVWPQCPGTCSSRARAVSARPPCRVPRPLLWPSLAGRCSWSAPIRPPPRLSSWKRRPGTNLNEMLGLPKLDVPTPLPAVCAVPCDALVTLMPSSRRPFNPLSIPIFVKFCGIV